MPHHVLVAHLAAMLAPIAAVLAVVYAAAPSTRRVLRWPLVVSTLLTAVLLIVAGNAGQELLYELQATGPAAAYEAAYRHAKSSDLATTAAVLAVVVALLATLRFLKPNEPRRRLSTAAAVVLGLTGVGLAASTVYTVALALVAVWTPV